MEPDHDLGSNTKPYSNTPPDDTIRFCNCDQKQSMGSLKNNSTSIFRGASSDTLNQSTISNMFIRSDSNAFHHNNGNNTNSAMHMVDHHSIIGNSIQLGPPTWIELIRYYLPCLYWLPNYTRTILVGDLMAGITIASFQIPLALSYATSIAHVDPLSGLYALAVSPFFYAIFGSTPQMIVGPEGAISLVIGQCVQSCKKHNPDLDPILIVIAVTLISGTILLISGIFRLGYLGNILNKALLHGFIGSVGFVMIIDSLINELKLGDILADTPEHYNTPFLKIVFLWKYAFQNFHVPTTLISFISIIILLIVRAFKKVLMHRHRWLIFIPEILIVLTTVLILSYKLDFADTYDIDILGDFKSNENSIFHNPLSNKNRGLIHVVFNIGIITAIFGFFESTTASKALGASSERSVSSNRELVALGLSNIVISTLGALPSFGGYGRSKINALSGGKTLLSGVFMGLTTILAILFLMPVIHYIPVCILSVITTVIGFTLLEEIPKEVSFHWRCRGYNELFLIVLTFMTSIFYSVETSMYIGCVYSILNIIKHSAKSRIQIYTDAPLITSISNPPSIDNSNINSNNNIKSTRSSDYRPESRRNSADECFRCSLTNEQTLIVKIPEPLTFTNCEDLKEKLNRFERLGTHTAHPGKILKDTLFQPKYIIFDLQGMTLMDSSATEILKEIVLSYRRSGSHIFFVNVSFRENIRNRIQASGIIDLIELPPVPPIDPNNESSSYADLDDLNYFSSIDDALIEIRKLKQTDSMSIQESYISATLLNSNLV
ncbi:hypothetical protein TBLA_0C05270 [Henningerozyma blattae CBS 6284]|uniref:STAS domain-containing protein n=1 Tax=Henningerozyma blattae (strain ATCC 34711 / CBS 6284 / DSM 70876 / NBRC 10599 / NRRL Y-10934 / UCD 77-7) TaxID=1071380 RepID=I2H1S1_HENB6|nr:hypothetical protein TBLA_0C05270 [Tetrapisispora blattae CBS 6284]CCH60323.1 hypothetical protein TBLA_0C05270 [Tetrapisispora blattae CBS 6284]